MVFPFAHSGPLPSGAGVTAFGARALLLGFVLCLCGNAAAAPQFPALTGRVVDEAGILSPQFESEIGALLAAHEQATTNQLVVVTLTSLHGYDIADYGYQLGRHWGIGQKGKNNGALLIVAVAERKMRIEVGYGLEGVLTDAVSRDIIERVIKPPFKQQRYEPGIRAGVNAILAALGGDYRPAPPPPTAVGTPDFLGYLATLIVIAGAVGGGVTRFVRRAFPRAGRALVAGVFGAIAAAIIWLIALNLILAAVIGIVVFLLLLLSHGRLGNGTGSGGWGSGGGWGGGDGGFSGGGGDFGGGGASGDW